MTIGHQASITMNKVVCKSPKEVKVVRENDLKKFRMIVQIFQLLNNGMFVFVIERVSYVVDDEQCFL